MIEWTHLVWMPEEQLATLDIALVNIICAEGLPGVDRSLALRCKDRLDYWTRRVRAYTEFSLKKFYRKRWDYHNSLAFFKTLCLVTCLQRECGLRYNRAKIPEDVPFEVEDSFIHGALLGSGGTCASMPVIYAAIGRRLGYPMKLVATSGKTAGHLFGRWDDGKERFNIEATGPGLSVHPDDYYRTGRYALSEKDEKNCCYLRSKTPRQELAGFMSERAYCWLDLKNYRQAAIGFAWAFALNPLHLGYRGRFWTTLKSWDLDLRRREPPEFPKLSIRYQRGRFPPSLPEKMVGQLFAFECAETLLNDPEHERNYWGPMRRGEYLKQKPVEANCSCDPGGNLLSDCSLKRISRR